MPCTGNLFSEAAAEKLAIALQGNTALKKIWPPWVMRYRLAWEMRLGGQLKRGGFELQEFTRLRQRRPQSANPRMQTLTVDGAAPN